MRIVGVDPGFKATGYGVLEFQNRKIKLLETGSIEPAQKDLIENRIYKVHKMLGDILDEFKPEMLVLEKLYAHYKHPITASKLGHVRGVICLLCAQKKIQLAEHSVKRIRKALVGNGNATKLQVRNTVGHILQIDANRLTLDASDALALALGYFEINGRQI